MLDWLRDFAGAIAVVAVATVSGIVGWIAKIQRNANAAHKNLANTNQRVSVLEKQSEHSNDLLHDIKEELRGLRADEDKGRARLHERIDAMAREFRDELRAKQDK